jgi:arsenate reductase
MDFIFTVCDSAAGEACPLWLGHPATAHWGIEDPAAVTGSDIDKERAFSDAYRFMRNRILAFVALPLDTLDAATLAEKLAEIGKMDGASAA